MRSRLSCRLLAWKRGPILPRIPSELVSFLLQDLYFTHIYVATDNSDFLTIHNAFASWRRASANPSFVRKFCRDNFLSHQVRLLSIIQTAPIDRHIVSEFTTD